MSGRPRPARGTGGIFFVFYFIIFVIVIFGNIIIFTDTRNIRKQETVRKVYTYKKHSDGIFREKSEIIPIRPTEG